MAAPMEPSAERIVLVVDDESVVRAIMERTLVQSGLRVLVAINGEEALSLLESSASGIGLVVTDVKMPVIDGMELMAAMAGRWPAIPVLMVSGSPPLNWHGPFLHKPFTPDQLLSAVQSLLPPADQFGVGRQ